MIKPYCEIIPTYSEIYSSLSRIFKLKRSIWFCFCSWWTS